MANVLTWLLAIIGPVAKRLLASLGIGWVVYSGYKLAVDHIKSEVVSLWGAIPGDIMSFLSLAGFGEAFGIILGALAFRASMLAVSQLGKLTQ